MDCTLKRDFQNEIAHKNKATNIKGLQKIEGILSYSYVDSIAISCLRKNNFKVSIL